MIKRKYVHKKYCRVTPNFLTQFKAELAEGYSWTYCCRTIAGEAIAVKKNFDRYPELKLLHEDYINRRLGK